MDSLNNEIRVKIENATNIVISAHRSPDGDSIGSSLAFYHLFRKWGKNVVVVHPDATPNYLKWVPGVEQIISFEDQTEFATKALKEADLFIALDYNELSRLGSEMQELVAHLSCEKIMFDHHLFPSEDFTYSISKPTYVSTTVVQYEWLLQTNKLNDIDETIGTCLYLGLMTDSGSFRFDTVNAFVHRMVADLMEKGIQHTKIHENTFDSSTLTKLKLTGYALSEKLQLIADGKIAFLGLTLDELNKYKYQKGDTEGLVNQMLGIQGVKMAAFFSETDDRVKISFRSKGEITINEFARTHFQGGGHKYASGGVSFDTMQNTLEKFVTLAENFILQQ